MDAEGLRDDVVGEGEDGFGERVDGGVVGVAEGKDYFGEGVPGGAGGVIMGGA